MALASGAAIIAAARWEGALLLATAGMGGIALAAAVRAGSVEDRERTMRTDASAGAQPDTPSPSRIAGDLHSQPLGREAGWRDLIDGQPGVILRRDGAGRLTFVNSGFCHLFSVDPQAVLGTDFAPVVLACGNRARPIAAHDLGDGGGQPAVRVELIETAFGPRWFEFVDRAVDIDGSRQHQSTGRDITEQYNAERLLNEARLAAEAASDAKSRFLATMSHEIRTPMNGILGMTDLLSDTPLQPDQKSYLDAIRLSARRLLGLIDEILDLSKIEAGRLQLADAPFAVRACVQACVELLGPKAHSKGLELAWYVAADVPAIVTSDEARLRQILLNLIGNAVKFTENGGVGVRVSRAASRPSDAGDAGSDRAWLRFEVTDTGPGVPPGALATLFGEFDEAGETMRRMRGGSGLGLAISRRLAHAMGGDVTVQSTPGAGSTFALDIGVACITAATNDVRDAVGLATRTLLAFDRRIERQAMANVLTDAGVEVSQCDTSEAVGALNAAARNGQPFRTVVIDATRGPVAAGVLLRAARGATRGKVRGLITIDAAGRTDLPEFRREGFDAYLMRPVRPESLLLHIGGLQAVASSSSEPRADEEHVARTPPAPQPPFKSVLLVEDDAINALLAATLLQRAGFAASLARTSQEAIDLLERQLGIGGSEPVFDIVLMDLHLPDGDGVQTMRIIRERLAARQRKAPPIIAVTASAFEEDRRRCLEAGMDGYVAKPFEREALLQLIDTFCPPRSHRGRHGSLGEVAA